MTARILKSNIINLGFDYAAAVEAFRQAKLDHRFTEGEPAPAAIAIVEAAVKRVPQENGPDDFVADYEIVDDLPPPPTLQERKRELTNQVHLQEMEAYIAVIPRGKRRLLEIQHREITGKPPEQRTAEDVAFLEDYDAKQSRIQAITKAGAILEAQIEDLTEETIAGWRMPELDA
jgi:hypothetical protein